MNIDFFFKEKCELISKRLKKIIPEKRFEYQVLFDAALYSLSEGKRLRPILTLIAADLFGVEEEKAIDPACSIELIHTYSLIHDDLPSMDNDDLRRGRPTLHKVYPEGIAVLTGDYLLTLAFDLLANLKHLENDKKIELIQCLSKYSGSNGMITGQVMDLRYEGKKINKETLYIMHQYKTASLFIACLEFGAILGKATTKEKLLLQEVGKKIGLLYQIQDDLFDSEEERNSDAVHEKVTAFTLLGTMPAKQLTQKLFYQIKQLLNKLEKPTQTLEEFINKVASRTA